MNDAQSQAGAARDVNPGIGDWADALEANRRPPPVIEQDWTRRRLAVIGIVVAVLFPFYQHAVQHQLAQWELQQAQREAAEALREASQAAAANASKAHADRAAREQQARFAAVRVVGAIDGNPPVVVVANLPPEGAAEVAETICAQAGIWLRRKVEGTLLRVTRDRGDRPGTDAGRVLCPRV